MLKNLLDKARDLKNQLDSLRPLSAEVEGRVMQKLRIDWNFHSNNMEGNSLTYGETRALLLYGMTAKGKPLSDHLEISGHEKAIEWLEDMARKKEELSGYFVRRLHEIIFSEQLNTKIKVGSYKEIPNFLISQTGETIQFATPEETPAKMNDLMDSYRKNAESEDINPILLAAAFHYEFVRIHPFDDGNGRMSRLLMNFILMRFGYPPAVIKTEEKENYYTALQLSDAQENSLPLAEYLAEAVINSLALMLKGARGERIEEPSDLDKQLAMLEKELLNKGTKIEKFYSKKTFAEWQKEIFPILEAKFKEVNQKFARFYTTADFNFKLINNFPENDVLLLSYSFENFTIVIGENEFMNYDTKVVIEFKQNQYVIKNVLANLYHVPPTEEQLNIFANEISKTHLAIIDTYKKTGFWPQKELPF